uniref:Condensin complex subunit 2 n=1 Tax=Timema tahoe TaxID=61484 RepID=A0A7R9FM70_9NEOP|nr:unnamed protein product [Timema tahoe]
MRMAGGLHQEEKKKKKGQKDEEENDENRPEGDESITIAKKKKPRRHRNVLAESSSLNAKEDSNPKLDPYFRRLMSALGETQEGDCQFLTSVKVGDDSCALQLFPEIPFWGEKQSVQAWQGNFSLPALPELVDLEICSSFSHFTFNNWSLEEDLALEARMKGNRPSGVEGVETPENPLPLEPDEEFAFDMAASPPPCGGADDYETDGEVDDTGIEIAVTCRAQDKSSLAIVDLHKHLSIAPQEYSYFRGSMLSLWAGPAHWKIRPLSKGKSSTSEVGAKEAAKKRRKKEIFVDFDALLHLEELNEKFSQIKGAKLSRKTVQMWSKERNTFPKDEHFISEVFYQLEIRKCVIVRRCDPEQSQIVDGQVDDYNYDNEHDRSSYCPNVDDDDGDGVAPLDDEGMTPFEEAPPPSQDIHMSDSQMPGTFTGDNLVEPPSKVARVFIPYALRPKKMDMKKLKAQIWSLLVHWNTRKSQKPDSYFFSVPRIIFAAFTRGKSLASKAVITPRRFPKFLFTYARSALTLEQEMAAFASVMATGLFLVKYLDYQQAKGRYTKMHYSFNILCSTSDLHSTTQHEAMYPKVLTLAMVAREKVQLPTYDSTKVEGEIRFTEVFKELPSKLSATMIENLSFPLAYIALLHLANEKCLLIVGDENLEDLMVSQDL